MPSPDRLAAFALASFVLILIPGPAVLFAISRALAYGRRTALMTVIGGALGSFVAATAVAIGVGAIIQASAVIYTVIKFAGAAYLIYLGVQAIRHRRALREAFEAQAAPISGGRTLLQGFIVGVTNPKTVVFFAAILPQFVDPSVGQAGLQMVVLGAVFSVIALAMDSVWGVAAGAVRSWFARSARRLDLVGGAAGLTMVGLGVGLAVSGRKES
ncbi:LysE family translocator [Amycolatopsis keratiniphila]|uniref:Lysine transporter LysE n=1 Tax=Amycolatopsis keratiniphila subsp. keratiniphila TaxID=227715 RepID=A0A1W2LWW4_9PSEU|nr:LysE family translocator [Amycolatopsis keratiniphila]OLZ58430.1 lysine transporter LysE [Amycolatopsis keratiniphila subsp. nogabecina]ONF70700.1 lysine transporter LysE [Amycolatopsis keratiniphila subsp. keratiniphila]SDU01491.1 Threonine/homoserine/homoserine lactone efflux protein [Amycolatopsis keratiniphila]